ncbi:DUF3365 domain-containing protein [Planctomyces sp. SH-PL14]|uniref:c-type heme family protein n=1 Tax=Planctomyces sp. SH-PL14 TaxID=1632864 RepID=UPI00078E8BF5|nr:DUF3365 domain-containing protein [Planctomyces sp. SH-PL14]AMV20751.1 hypothetical protein VT03_22815 [Planctomyces sp. SH-PL14]
MRIFRAAFCVIALGVVVANEAMKPDAESVGAQPPAEAAPVPTEPPRQPPPREPAKSQPTPRRPTVEEARDRAVLLHDLANEMLRAIHQAYYREDEGLPIPALLLRDVFQELGTRRQVEFRWLAVDADAMNVDHKAKTDFEKSAVQALAMGELMREETAEGVYRQIGVVPLTSECLKCHLPNRRSTRTRHAALMITIPVTGT